MELKFIKCGDYYVPDIKLKETNIRLGKWGRMRKEYLRLAQPITFSEMVLSETLYEHCAEIEETAKKRLEIIIPQLAKAYGGDKGAGFVNGILASVVREIPEEK